MMKDFIKAWMGLALAALSAVTISVLGVLLARGELDGEGAAVLIVVVVVCVLLGAGGRDLIKRIVKVGPLELSETTSAQEELPEPQGDPSVSPAQGIDAMSEANPWIRRPMTSYEKWKYEQVTIRLVRLRQQGRLQGADSVEQFRGQILDVGEAALNQAEFAKGLDILKLLEPIGKNTARELLSLGTAYLWAGLEDYMGKQQRQECLGRALLYLEEASRTDKTSAITFWTMGYVYDDLGRYPAAIAANEEAIRLDPRFLPWANWHIAVSLLKLAKQQQEMGNVEQATADTNEAMQKVEQIPPGLWWEKLYKDDELKGLREHPDYRDKFSSLYEDKQKLSSDTQA